MARRRRKKNPKITCGPERSGVKTCRVAVGADRGRTFRAHAEATAATERKRKAGARRLAPYRFTKADAKACKQGDRKARGRCMAERAQARAG